MAAPWQISADGANRLLWARNGRELFYVRQGRMFAVEISTTPGFRAGTPKPLGAALAGPNFGWDVAADGERFLTAKLPEQQEQAAPGQLHVVMEWFEELRRRAPPAKK